MQSGAGIVADSKPENEYQVLYSLRSIDNISYENDNIVKEEVIDNLTLDTWEQVKLSRNGKKLFLIEDFDINSMFFVYI